MILKTHINLISKEKTAGKVVFLSSCWLSGEPTCKFDSVSYPDLLLFKFSAYRQLCAPIPKAFGKAQTESLKIGMGHFKKTTSLT